MYEWVIVGGGIHGCTIAVYLLKSGKVDPSDLLIIDRYDQPLHKWSMITNKIGMDYLRSPSVHHMDQPPFSLQNFLNEKEESNASLGRYKRPRLDLFNEHCENLFDSLAIKDVWYQADVNDIQFVNENWRVYTNQSEFVDTKRVVLALGVNEQPNYPAWAESIRENAPERIHHIFEERSEIPFDNDRSCVVGGGISAAHMAVKLCEETKQKVTLFKRHPFRIHDFDSDPGWLGPKFLTAYYKVDDLVRRRSIITSARNRGRLRETYS